MVGSVTDRRSLPMAVSSRPRRVLVISNETVEAEILRDTIAARADRTQVLVVAPALNTRLRHWLSDEDPARRAAERRLAGALAALRAAGVDGDGWGGGAAPPLATEGARPPLAARQLVVPTPPWAPPEPP